MIHRLLLFIAAISLFTLAVLGQTKPAPAGQTAKAPAWTQPKTSWGDPDLQGTWTSDDYINIPLSRPEDAGTRLQRTPQEIAAQQTAIETRAQRDAQEFAGPNPNIGTGPPAHWGEGARRPAQQTSMVIVPEDGRVPALTPEGQARTAASNAARQAAGGTNNAVSWEAYSFYIRCISRGLMGSTLPVIYGNGSQIVQGPGYVAILYEMVHEARIIPIGNSPHPGPNVRSYMGDARGRWEGNTLVVETTNFLPNTTAIGPNGGNGPVTSEDLKVTERFTRTGARTMNYQATIEDPKTFTKPFTIGFPITREPGYANFEYACHEGNHAMSNSLSAARALERQ